MVAAPEIEREVVLEEASFRDLADKALEEADDVHEQAILLLMQWIEDDPSLDERAKPIAYHRFCRSLVEDRYNAQRKAARSTLRNGPQVVGGGGAVGLAMVAESTFMEYPLSGGKVLGDMGRDGLIQEADGVYKKRADTLFTVWRWLRVVAKDLPAGKRVRDHYTEDALGALYRKAEQAKG